MCSWANFYQGLANEARSTRRAPLTRPRRDKFEAGCKGMVRRWRYGLNLGRTCVISTFAAGTSRLNRPGFVGGHLV